MTRQTIRHRRALERARRKHAIAYRRWKATHSKKRWIEMRNLVTEILGCLSGRVSRSDEHSTGAAR
jgi:hypothetical protein